MLMSPADLGLAWSTGLLAFSLGISSASKFSSSATTLQAMRALRVPRLLSNIWTARAVPLLEMFLAVLVLFGDGWIRGVGAFSAAMLLIVFTVFIIGVLRRQETVDCGCFGVLSSDSRVSLWSVARNCVLILAALLTVLWGLGRPSLVAVLATRETGDLLAVILSWAFTAIVALSIAQFQLRKRLTKDGPANDLPVVKRLENAPVEMGSEIPDAELVGGDRRTSRLKDIGQGSPVLLVFLSAECGSCATVADHVPEWNELLSPILVRVATSSRPDIVDERLSNAVPNMLFGALAARAALGISSVPAAVALGGSQQPVIASPIVYGVQEIEALVEALVVSSRNG